MRLRHVRLGQAVLSLSSVLSLGARPYPYHQHRVAYIAAALAEELGLDDPDGTDLFFAALLHDVGKLAGPRLEPQDGGTIEEREAQRGYQLLSGFAPLKRAAAIIRHHLFPERAQEAGEVQPRLCQLLLLSDHVERALDGSAFVLEQVERVLEWVEAHPWCRQHPESFAALRELAAREHFWLDLASPRLDYLLRQTAAYCDLSLNLSEFHQLSTIFSRLVDSRCSYTTAHSPSVAAVADLLASGVGFSDEERRMLHTAGLLHDLGKVTVPRRILDKPGDLDQRESRLVRQHSYYTYRALGAVGGLGEIVEWAAYHHERLDGSGYPFHYFGERLTPGARILAIADVYTALLENRPYRRGMSYAEVAEILKDYASRRALDEGLVEAVLRHGQRVQDLLSETGSEPQVPELAPVNGDEDTGSFRARRVMF